MSAALNIRLGPDPNLWPKPFKDRYLIKLRRKRRSVNPYAKYQQDPHSYAKNVLGIDLTDDQDKMLWSIVRNRYTLAMASHAIGKSFLAAVALSWWYDCWTSHIGYVTAPTWHAALNRTFKQLKALRRSHKLPGIILETGVVRDEDQLFEGEHYIRALNSEKGEGFQGEHEAPILIVIEEGVGVPKYIWEAIKGLMTSPENRLFVIGNPTDEATEFGAAAESPLYNVFSISALDHPNIKAELACQPPPIPKAVSLQWIYEMLTTECEPAESLTEDVIEWHAVTEIENALAGRPADLTVTSFYKPNATFQGKVIGMFPTQADQNVVPKGWLKNLRVIEIKPSWHPEIGCDVAHFGDDRTTVVTRRGPCLLKIRELRKLDTLEVASACKDAAIEAAKQWKPEITKPAEQEALAKKLPIKIDVTGGLGRGPYDQLKKWGYNAIAINSSERANDPEQFDNTRSELWWTARLRAQEKRLDLSRLPKAMRDKLIREWSAPKYKNPGHKVVEKKAELKKRLGVSPDIADGANLALYNRPQTDGLEIVGRL